MAEPLRIMSLHALAYCERLFYLEEMEEMRVADERVYAGRRLHVEIEKKDDVRDRKGSVLAQPDVKRRKKKPADETRTTPWEKQPEKSVAKEEQTQESEGEPNRYGLIWKVKNGD
ncbi:MAG: hypothetical protein LC776_01295 [Acidobacteria bacterium]|nr:hypothetical protein [Acidobacteriota bacterium]